MDKMKRRIFIKSTTLASIAFSTIPMVGCSVDQKKKALSLNDIQLLKGYDDEQEEDADQGNEGYR